MDIFHTVKPKDGLPKLWREHRLTQPKKSVSTSSVIQVPAFGSHQQMPLKANGIHMYKVDLTAGELSRCN